MKINDVNLDKVTPMMRQYIEIKRENPDIIIFFRLGDFYEMFFEDAVTVSHELELVLTGKNAGLEEKVPMCGVPHHAVNIYLEKLILKGYKVGICEQLEDPKNTKGIVKRDLIQIVSAGTIINNESLVENESNYIGSVIDLGYAYILSFMDITTGLSYIKLINHTSTLLVSEIIGYGIKEIIMTSSVSHDIYLMLKNQFNITVTITDNISNMDEYKNILEDISDDRYVKSMNHLLTYVTNSQKKDLPHLQKPTIIEGNKYLKMDIHTKRNLELTETIRQKDRNYSLIWLLDRTKTAMGSRMLKNYIENPLVDEKEINKRYDIVETLLKEFILKDELQNYLYEVYDLERLSGRIGFGNANGKDLLQLKNSIKVLPNIKEILSKINYKCDFDDLYEVYELLENSIYENPPVSIKEGFLIKSGYNKELDELKELRKGGKDFIARFEAEEKERTGIKNLKVGYNRVFGYYIEVSKGNTNLIKEEYGYDRKQTLSNCERYISPILKEKEALILNAEEKIIELEYNLFCEVRDTIKKYIPKIQYISKIISEIDVLQSFATVSEENKYVRPVLTDDRSLLVHDSRHPVVEKVMNSEFVPNDIIMDNNTNILLITGPNMAGKSTYMRQVAITVIMAQIGCFVPAHDAKLPIFDQIFTRIGASDDLVSGESTFMVEMTEANNAILNATNKSLILFDELGRGTATFDGMALAQSIIEYVNENIKAKTFFSTHYHELTDLENTMEGIKNIHVSAYEENGNLTFLHKIKEGSVDKSYGIYVAKLAKLPASLIKRADQILKVYEDTEVKRDTKIQESINFEELDEKSEVEEYIKNLDPLLITPMQALNIICELKEKVNK